LVDATWVSAGRKAGASLETVTVADGGSRVDGESERRRWFDGGFRFGWRLAPMQDRRTPDGTRHCDRIAAASSAAARRRAKM
jgi:hypothetical protein